MARRAGNPIVVLTSIAVTITMVLLVVWQWAEASSTVDAEPTYDASADAGVALTTPLLSVRRAPGVLSHRLNVAAFAAELEQLRSAVGSGSCLAVSVDGRPVVARNETSPVIPASNMKLIVAAVALEVLGANYRFRTTAIGEQGADGVVAGDLVLVGGGDPVLGTDWWPLSGQQTYPPINTTRLEELADAVVAAGVTRVSGRVVGDGSRYDDEFFGPTWDESLQVTEGGPYDALLVNDARVTPQRVADVPALGAAELFTQLLRDRGVPVGQGFAEGTGDFGTEVAAISSQPLSAIIAEMLLTSDDNTAEMLVKEIGHERSGSGTTSAGLQVITEQLLAWDVPLDGVDLVDGSGLSRDNRVTCAALLAVLQHGSLDDAVGQGLPVAGESGTLAESFAGTEVEGTMRAKTGSLSGVKALAGYLPVEGGSVVEFALVLNSPGIDGGGYLGVWYDLLAPALVTYPSEATVAELEPR